MNSDIYNNRVLLEQLLQILFPEWTNGKKLLTVWQIVIQKAVKSFLFLIFVSSDDLRFFKNENLSDVKVWYSKSTRKCMNFCWFSCGWENLMNTFQNRLKERLLYLLKWIFTWLIGISSKSAKWGNSFLPKNTTTFLWPLHTGAEVGKNKFVFRICRIIRTRIYFYFLKNRLFVLYLFGLRNISIYLFQLINSIFKK